MTFLERCMIFNGLTPLQLTRKVNYLYPNLIYVKYVKKAINGEMVRFSLKQIKYMGLVLGVDYGSLITGVGEYTGIKLSNRRYL